MPGLPDNNYYVQDMTNKGASVADLADEAEKCITLAQRNEIISIRIMLTQTGQESCQDCGETISDERRRIIPSAVTCYTCQDIRELREKTLFK